MTLTFYTNAQSRGRIARWMLEEVGQPYDTVLVDWQDKPAALLEANPLGKVPTIVHDGHVVTEAAAVCAYLAQAFPDAGLAPTPQEAAPYFRWMFFAAAPLEQAMMDRFRKIEVPPEQRGMIGYGNFDAAVDTLAFALSQAPYVAGDRFTAADVAVGSAVSWFTMFKLLPERPVFADYLARLHARDGFKRASEIDDAAAAKR